MSDGKKRPRWRSVSFVRQVNFAPLSVPFRAVSVWADEDGTTFLEEMAVLGVEVCAQETWAKQHDGQAEPSPRSSRRAALENDGWVYSEFSSDDRPAYSLVLWCPEYKAPVTMHELETYHGYTIVAAPEHLVNHDSRPVWGDTFLDWDALIADAKKSVLERWEREKKKRQQPV